MSDDVEVRVDGGRLAGVAASDRRSGAPLQVFLGIPYAAPPVGDLRWRPPQPVAPWAGTRRADRFGDSPAQRPEPFDAAPVRGGFSEDCLTLNVWAPVAPASTPRPVMVWIHGGGFVSGGSSPARYDGGALAARGVVVVSINYRLGRLGFFAHPALRRGQGDEGVGNFGLMDQLAALRWVQRNVAAFGGDPGCVTVFGESAGAASVAWLLACPQAQGLFQRAAMQSAPARESDALGRRTFSLDDASAMGADWARGLGVPDGDDAATLAALRALPVDALTAGLSLLGNAPDFTGPVVGGLWARSAERAASAGAMLRVPVLVGANSDEMGFFASPMLASRQPAADVVLNGFGESAPAVAAAYRDALLQGGARFIATLRGDQVFVEPTRFLARALAPHQPTYAYRFGYAGPGAAPGQGALHASEIPYVFDTVHTVPEAGADEQAVADCLADAWVAFARTGAPAGWPRWRPGEETLAWIDARGATACADPAAERLDAITASLGRTPDSSFSG